MATLSHHGRHDVEEEADVRRLLTWVPVLDGAATAFALQVLGSSSTGCSGGPLALTVHPVLLKTPPRGIKEGNKRGHSEGAEVGKAAIRITHAREGQHE